MSILILGKTKCPLCGDVIDRHEDAIQLPAFLWSEVDPLSVFNDASLHQACFGQDPRYQEVLGIVHELGERTGPGTRFCVVCGEEITDPDDYILLPLMTRDPTHPLYPLRYTHLHRSHAASWGEIDAVVKLLHALAGKAEGQAFRHLLAGLKQQESGAPDLAIRPTR